MFKVKSINHIGIVVTDFAEAKEFFEEFGFTVQGEQDLEIDLLDKVTGVKGSKSHVAFMESSDGQVTIELTQMLRPTSPARTQQNHIYSLGIQHICFIVEDIDGIVQSLKAKGRDFITEIETYENMKVCYFYGPDNIILELTEIG